MKKKNPDSIKYGKIYHEISRALAYVNFFL